MSAKDDLVKGESKAARSLKQWMVLLLKATVTTALMVWLFGQLDFGNVLPLLQQAHLAYVASAFAFMLCINGLAAWRQQLLLRALHIHLPFQKLCSVALISNLFQYSLPGIGGDGVAKLYYVTRATGRPVETIFSGLLDGSIGFVALISVPLAVIPFHPMQDRLGEAIILMYTVLLGALLLAICLGLLVKRHPEPFLSERIPGRVAALLKTLTGSLDLFSQQKGLLLRTFGIALASHLLHIVIYYHLAASLGVETRLLDFALVLPIVTLATVIPVSFGGLGVREWTFISLFTELGMPRQAALSISLLRLVVKGMLMLLGAALYLKKEKVDHE